MDRRKRSGIFGLGALVVAVALVGGFVFLRRGGDVAEAPAGATPYPSSIGVIGDSISQGVNLDTKNLGAKPQHAWATGASDDDGVESHYERILAEHPAIRGKATNASVSGSKMADAPAQAAKVAASGAEYVLVEMGGNDLCTGSLETMTSVDAYERDFEAALTTLVQANRDVRILVASIPDVHQLWDLFHDDRRANFVWRSFRVCQSLLAASNTDAQRAQVRERNVAFNEVLARVCDQFDQCRSDRGAVFETELDEGDVSNADFFHPSKQGQARLAEVSWEAGYWS